MYTVQIHYFGSIIKATQAHLNWMISHSWMKRKHSELWEEDSLGNIAQNFKDSNKILA